MAAERARYHFPVAQGLSGHTYQCGKLGEKVDKATFNTDMAVLSIAPDDVIDIYGFFEQMGLNYPDCSAETPARLLNGYCSRRVGLSVLPDGEPGLLKLSAHCRFVPWQRCSDDIGYGNSICECGRAGPRFRVLGRAKRLRFGLW